MKYPYNIIHKGKWYRAGEEVPANESGASEPQKAADTIKRKPGRPKKSES